MSRQHGDPRLVVVPRRPAQTSCSTRSTSRRRRLATCTPRPGACGRSSSRSAVAPEDRSGARHARHTGERPPHRRRRPLVEHHPGRHHRTLTPGRRSQHPVGVAAAQAPPTERTPQSLPRDQTGPSATDLAMPTDLVALSQHPGARTSRPSCGASNRSDGLRHGDRIGVRRPPTAAGRPPADSARTAPVQNRTYRQRWRTGWGRRAHAFFGWATAGSVVGPCGDGAVQGGHPPHRPVETRQVDVDGHDVADLPQLPRDVPQSPDTWFNPHVDWWTDTADSAPERRWRCPGIRPRNLS